MLQRVRAAQPTSRALPYVPLFDTALLPPLETFQAVLRQMGGEWLDLASPLDLDAAIRTLFPDAAVICSAAPEAAGTRRATATDQAGVMDDVDVGIVRAAFGVAETGSVWLSEAQLQVNALGYLAQHLVVLLDPADIVGNLHQAYLKRGFFEARYAVLMSGPSATADIEGVLIRGAQGVRSLTVIFRARCCLESKRDS